MSELAHRVTHRVPMHDTIDHETTATNGDEFAQCPCGPDWHWAAGESRHLIAEHHALHGDR